MRAINTGRDPSAAEPADARVLSLRRGPNVAVLPEDDLERIVASVYRVLEETGVDLRSTTLAERLGAAGARTDGGTRVRFPASLVDEALRQAPSALVLAGRDPSSDLRIDGAQGWLGTGGSAERIVDLETDERRASILSDVADAARLADAIPQIGFAGPSASALDVPSGLRDLRELHALVASTSKHVQIEVSARAGDADAVVDIARAVAAADGEAALRDRPVVSAFLTTSALALDGEGLEAAVTLARAGMPCGFVSAPTAGATAPATVAGALVTSAAETLAGVAALQLLAPGAPTFVGTRGLLVGRHGAHAVPGGPQDPLFQLAWVQLARRLGLATQVGAFATGSKSSDWQAGMEGGLSGTAAWMNVPDLLGGAGLRDGGRICSPTAMLLDAELFDLVRRVPLGFAVDEETLALEVIEKVGPGDHFLGEPHTLRHMREMWTARFMDTDTWEAWEEAGRPQPPERAHARALELLETHEPAPLEPTAEARIQEVIAERERDHG